MICIYVCYNVYLLHTYTYNIPISIYIYIRSIRKSLWCSRICTFTWRVTNSITLTCMYREATATHHKKILLVVSYQYYYRYVTWEYNNNGELAWKILCASPQVTDILPFKVPNDLITNSPKSMFVSKTPITHSCCFITYIPNECYSYHRRQ